MKPVPKKPANLAAAVAELRHLLKDQELLEELNKLDEEAPDFIAQRDLLCNKSLERFYNSP